MPCYRCARSVAEAVRSAREQSASALELIIVDDASDDETPTVLQTLQRTFGDKWLRVIRLERNGGAATARNAGWQAARGEYVAFLDSDDSWHPRKLEIQHGWMAANPAVRISAHESTMQPRGQASAAVQEPPAVRFLSPSSYLLKNPFITPSVMLRRDLQYRFLEGRRHMEDHLLWQIMALSGERIAILQAPLATIHKARYGAGGLSADLLAMELAELANYWALRGQHLISLPAALALSVFSLMKFVRRLTVVALRRLSG